MLWRFGSRSDVFGRVDGGRFEINTGGDGVIVNFDYYVSLVFWILFIGFFSFFALTKDIHILYFIPVILIIFYFKVENVKSTAIGMMRDIVKVE